MFSSNSLLPFFTDLKHIKKFWVAYSGGLDSHVLLHALAHLPQKLPLAAVHINHGWHPQATEWGDRCLAICKNLNIPCQVIVINAQAQKGQSLEAIARTARYEAFAKIMEPNDCLLTAHQQDDQAETLLLQLFRGAGIKGLAAMPAIAPFAQGYHARPLLNFSRAELLTYAQQNDLHWIEDSSNNDLRFDRNFVRQQILPLIRQRWSVAALARTAKHCAETTELLDRVAQKDLKKLSGTQYNTLSIKKLLSLKKINLSNVIRYWLRQLNFPAPSEAQLQHIKKDILESRSDAYPCVKWDQVEIRRYQDDLYALPIQTHNTLPPYSWDLTQPLELPGIGLLTAESVLGKGLRQSAFSEVIVRFRQGGERLKKRMQEWHIPPWQRDRIPLLFVNDQLIAVVGYGIHTAFAAHNDEKGWLISLKTC